jgi:hypothetical protein
MTALPSDDARHATALIEAIAPLLPARLQGLERSVDRRVHDALFPGVPYAGHGTGEGRSTALASACAPDGSVPHGGHVLALRSRTWQDGRPMPSKTFDVYGPSPNVQRAIAALRAMHARGVRFPMVVYLRSALPLGPLAPIGSACPSARVGDGDLVRAWAASDLATLIASCPSPPAGWSTFHGLPELPPEGHPARPTHVGRAGHPADVYVTHPADDGARGYRRLVVSARRWEFADSGTAGLARWLATDGW